MLLVILLRSFGPLQLEKNDDDDTRTNSGNFLIQQINNVRLLSSLYVSKLSPNLLTLSFYLHLALT